ncbi:putative protein OS=Streptomyces griseorubiginosus OX=67304 GN=DWG14_03713 PE=4 SV=1 [Streptomyces griseorubiginosus]|uniref:Uncharacterized protein n=1 Tax=Streptomyces griseorubiginosus TaxID=67304 RepID=A0AAI8L1B0_9ACTN|nr:hypothetical protein DWG14_03713 [Streptomyces griseorubiginosus]
MGNGDVLGTGIYRTVGVTQTAHTQGRGAVSICGSAAWARPATTHPQPPHNLTRHPAKRYANNPRNGNTARRVANTA